MRLLTRPVWSEGMYLGPHHFQAQGRYFEDALNFVTDSLWRDPFGFAGLEIDQDALRGGTLCLTHARGLFEDGLAFDLPAHDQGPPPRSFGGLFSPVADHLTMHLAIPRFVPDGQNTGPEGAMAATRYLAVEQTLPDLNTGVDERPIQFGRKNLRLIGEQEATRELVTLPLVRIVRDGKGQFEADPSFVPPVVSLKAAARLLEILARLIDILEEKSTAFTDEAMERNGLFQAGLSGRLVAQYWFLHTLNSSLPALRHIQFASQVHPEELYREMARLGGALCTFGLETHPKTLAGYDHRNLGACFSALDQHIRRHLEIVLPSRAIRIPLTPVESFLYQGEVADERCLGPSRWILEISSPIGEVELIRNVPSLAKLCSARFVMELIKRAVPGLALRHLSVPPAQIPGRVESQYFSISREGPCWEHIVKTRQLGLYVPAEIPAPQLGVYVLIDE